jgi:hypothetical protein
MSTLFAVRVLEVSTKAARLEVTSIHPDSGRPAPRAVFALMLIYDPILNAGYREFRRYEHLEDSALAQAMDQRDSLDHAWLQANARAFVDEVTVSGSVVEIVPTHPGWTEHLRKGMKWETAAYDGGPGLPAAPRVPAPRGASGRVEDPAAGFRVGRPKLSGCAIDDALIPVHGPNHYVAEPLLTDATAMARATRKLLGQPLLITPKRGPKRVGTLVERHREGVTLYHEADEGYGGFGVAFADLKSLGRAWLMRSDAPEPEQAKPKKAATVKKAAVKKPATKKAATKKAATKKAATKKAATKKAATKKAGRASRG